MKVLIVDDEPEARAGLRCLLQDEADYELVGEASGGRQAIEQIRSAKPDLVLLDIQMPGVDGFDVLAGIGLDQPPLFVFITAHDEHTLRAFEVHALDYLLKPFSERRFRQAMERARQRHRERNHAQLGDRLHDLLATQRSESGAPLKRFAVKRSDETSYVDIEQVRWIEAEEYCVRLHLRDGRSHVLRGNLGSFEQRLGATRFVRVHRSAMVHLACVRSLRELFKGSCAVVLDDGTEVKVSRSRRDELERRLVAG